jgi:hypothetical protein
LEHLVVQLLHIGAWIFGIVFLFAIIGLFAVIQWVTSLFRRTESAVEGGIQNVEARLHR